MLPSRQAPRTSLKLAGRAAVEHLAFWIFHTFTFSVTKLAIRAIIVAIAITRLAVIRHIGHVTLRVYGAALSASFDTASLSISFAWLVRGNIWTSTCLANGF